MTDSAVAALSTILDAATRTDDLGPAAVDAALKTLGVPKAGRAELSEQVHRARREMARLRRREQELTALFSSARELAELRDIDAVLARLVQRAHEMMGVHVAYLSEFDSETRELRVRETSGSISESFRSLRVPPGRGLASVVVESRAPQWVAEYADYADERHDLSVDSAVSAEGLVSLLGVPMLTSDDVLGVLFVATRERKSFSPDEISLLSALADHASATLQATQLFAEVTQSEQDARQTLDDLTAYLAERDRANAVHQELVQAVLAGGGFSPVTGALASALARPVAIIDTREQVIAASGMPLSAAMLSLSDTVRAAIDQSRRSGLCVAVDAPGVSAVAALTAGSQSFGAIVLGEGEGALDGVDLHSVERAAQVTSLIHLQQEAASGADHRLRSELVADLLDDVPERRPDVERRARRLGIELQSLDSLLLLSVPGDQQSESALALALHIGDVALIGEYRGFVVAVYSAGRLVSDAETLRANVARSIGQPVTAVHPSRADGGLPAAFAVAVRTARLLSALEIAGIATTPDEYLPYAAAFDTDPQGLASFLQATIGAVRRYDAERQTELLPTLRAFVRNGASPTRTARALSFHTNTILQRLERLDQILGDGWRDDERMFRIGVAVRLDELRERLTRPKADLTPGRSPRRASA